MVIETVFTLALYCPCCGKTKDHEISWFDFKNKESRKLICSCGQIQAEVKSIIRGQCLLYIPCPVCQTRHVICINSKNIKLKRLYCYKENLELGFVGSPSEVAHTIAQHKHGLQMLEADTDIKNPQIIVGMLNRLHDIAENGRLYCECGSFDIEANLLDDGIELFCLKCGEHLRFFAQVEDLRYLKSINDLELMCKPYSQRK